MKVDIKQNFNWENKEFIKQVKKAWGITKNANYYQATLKQIFLIRNEDEEGNFKMLATDGYRLFVKNDWTSFDFPFKTRVKTLSLKIDDSVLIIDRLKKEDKSLLENILRILDSAEKVKKHGLMLNLKEPLKKLEKFDDYKRVTLELKSGKTYLKAEANNSCFISGKAEFLLQDNNELPKLNLKIAFNASYALSLLNELDYTVLSFTENPLQPFLIDGSVLMPIRTR